jgi:adenylate cyclase
VLVHAAILPRQLVALVHRPVPPGCDTSTRLAAVTLVIASRLWDAFPVDAPPHDELRPITVLFADVVGSTALGERLPPDEVKALVGECVSRMSAAAEAYGGFVQAYQGDGICVFFGVPSAHEDDPERAAFAALEILDVASDSARDIREAWGVADFAVRLGLNTGTAAVGLVGAQAPHPVALGDVTNTAARLQAAADPGTILAGPRTAKRLEARFRLTSAGAVALKGKREPVDAWWLLGARGAERRGGVTPFVDRRGELERIQGVVEAAADRGLGQVLVVLGPAGIGKTRLVDEAAQDASDRVTWVRGEARSSASSVTYATVMNALRSWLEIGSADPEIVVRTRLHARAAELMTEASIAGLGSLLGIRGMPASSDPQAAIVTWIETLAERGPLALVLDDLQWADRPTGEVVEHALQVTERLPLLLVLCLRPDPGSEGWRLRLLAMAEYSHRTTEVSLGRLDHDAAERLAMSLAPNLDDATRSELLAEADGNPLYVEELARDLSAAGIDRHHTWTLTALPVRPLPSALESLMISRVDRLPVEARQVVQAAAVLGKSFPVGVLKAMAADDSFDEHMQMLLRADLIRETRRYPTFECAFTHGLLQEAVLATLPSSRQQALYRAAAQAMEEQPGEDTIERLELLAECYARSDELERALEYLTRAETLASDLGTQSQAAEYRRRAAKVAARLNRTV